MVLTFEGHDVVLSTGYREEVEVYKHCGLTLVVGVNFDHGYASLMVIDGHEVTDEIFFEGDHFIDLIGVFKLPLRTICKRLFEILE